MRTFAGCLKFAKHTTSYIIGCYKFFDYILTRYFHQYISMHLPCTNGVLLLHRIVSVVPLSKLQPTSFLHAPYIVHQKEYKVCWSWMMTPDAGLKSTPSTSKPSEEDAQPHDDDDAPSKNGLRPRPSPYH